MQHGLQKGADDPCGFRHSGGDHIFDGLPLPASLPTYEETQQQLGLKTYHTTGNHDLLGIYTASGMHVGDANYGKAYFEQHIGPLYQSFDHKGVHFIVLDSIGLTPERGYYGLIDSVQIQWLKADLARQPSVTDHCLRICAADHRLRGVQQTASETTCL